LTFLAPLFLSLAGAAAVATLVLHLLAVRQPPEYELPTARFVPDASVRAASMSRRPTDILLLILRMLALLLAGAAFARPVLLPERSELRRVILVDRSGAVAESAEAVELVRSITAEGDLIVQFADSALPPLSVSEPAEISLAPLSPHVGSLTTAMVAGQRAAAALRDSAEAVEIILLSPVVAGQIDAGTHAARRLWPGAMRVERLRAAAPDSSLHAIQVSAPDEDPVAAGARLAGKVAVSPTRIDRSESGDLTLGQGEVVVNWPVSGIPDGWVELDHRDTVPAVVGLAIGSASTTSGSDMLVAPFERAAVPPEELSGSRAIAWWSDGRVAAVERSVGDGCIRDVGVIVPEGDVVLRPSFARFLSSLSVACGSAPVSLAAVPDSLLHVLRGGGETAVSAARSAPESAQSSPLAPWLLASALALLAAEMFLRGREPEIAEASA
jgi:hypothetical protein